MESIIEQMNQLRKENKEFNQQFENVIKEIKALDFKIKMKNTNFCVYRCEWNEFNKTYSSRKLSFNFDGVVFCVSLLKDIKYIFVGYAKEGNLEKISCQMMLKQFCEVYDTSQILFSPQSKTMINCKSSAFSEYVRIYIRLNFF